MSATDARRQLSKFARTGRNWRLQGLYLAHPQIPSGYSERDVAKAWPVHKTDYHRLGADKNPHDLFPSDKQYTMEEDSEAFHQLSDATDEASWSTGPFEEQTIHADRAIKHALAFQDSIENLDTLFRKEIFDTIIEGARKAEVARDAATVFPVDRSRGDHPRGQDTRFAPLIAEGGAIPDDAEQPDTVEWEAVKFGSGARATEELIDQANVSVIERQIMWLGHQCEMRINRILLNELIDNADTDNDVDSSGESNRALASVNEAIHQVELNDEQPDSIVVHPTYHKTLFDEGESTVTLFAQQFGDDEPVRDRLVFPILGLQGFRMSTGVYEGDETWNYTGTDETGAVVYDSERVGLYIYRDIEQKEYDDPVRDLEGVNARAQVDAVWHKEDAGARILHSESD